MINSRILILIFVVIVISAFQVEKPDKESLMAEALINRVEKYKKGLLDKCREKVLSDAEMMVDSIIAVELGAGPIDTLDFPPKPQRPAFESYDSLQDVDVELKPLFLEEGKNLNN